MLRILIAFLVVFFAAASAQAAGTTEVQWLGHAAFKITSLGGKVILIDPFITKNPKTPDELKDLSKLGRVDLILITHGHGDHLGDMAQIAEMSGAPVAMNADMGRTVAALGLVPPKQIIRFNKSGSIAPLNNDITISMTRAEHSSAIVWSDPETDKTTVHPGGEPSGYILRMENGFTIYHAGDTGVFGDMALIGTFYAPDLALLPIGGHFTMGPRHAAYAASELLKVKRVVPMHYGTFPPLKGTPEQLIGALGASDVEVVVLKPGESRFF